MMAIHSMGAVMKYHLLTGYCILFWPELLALLAVSLGMSVHDDSTLKTEDLNF